jgi:hypothetical protein
LCAVQFTRCLTVGVMDRDAVATPADAEAVADAVAATAISRKRTVLAQVNADGYVCGVQLLAPVVRKWDAETLEARIKAVAAVAHDRYLAGLPAESSACPTLEDVADSELSLDF